MPLRRLRLPQSIRNRVVFAAGVVFALLLLTQYVVQHGFLMPQFARIERTQAYAAMDRVADALAREEEGFVVSARDWGNWIETYRYVHEHDREYLSVNVNAAALRDIHAHLVAVIDTEGRILSVSAYDPHSGEPTETNFLAGTMLDARDPLRAALGRSAPLAGLVRSDHGPLLVATAPVLNGTGQGRPAGLLVLGRFLLADELARSANVDAGALRLLAPGIALPGSDARRPSAGADTPDDRVLESETTTTLYREVKDLSGMPVATLRLAVAREISQGAIGTILGASLALGLLAALAILGLVYFLDRRVLRPLHEMTEHAVRIGASDDLSLRIGQARGDELGKLARAFDQMLSRLEQARSELIEKSFGAGVAEMASGALHNLGNALTPLSVRVSAIGEALRRAPAKDMELVLAELGDSEVAPGRRADLERFALLVGADLAHAIGTASEDARAAERQLQSIQHILTDQVRQSRAGAVLESVRPRELIAQSIDLVAPALRARLNISVTPALGALEVMRLPTVVLRQVFQNLIVNAAEAVGEPEHERVRLTISGEVVDTKGYPELALQFTDEGPGIAPEILERLFQRQFSTKSKDTNSGIGLHWCGNALRSLGGEIRATSAGLGHGACFHVVVPLKAARTGEAVRAA